MRIKKGRRSPKAPAGIFLVFRLPLLILLILGLLGALGLAGWRHFYGGSNSDPAVVIRRRMEENISALESYHARYRTTPAGEEGETAYSVEIWKEVPHRYRLEMTTTAAGRQSTVEVIIGEHDRVYLYDPGSGGFLPAAGLTETGVSTAFLEDYWHSICEAPLFDYIGEEGGSRHSYYMIEITPAEPHRYRVSEKVWLEKKTFLPVRIESFDLAGSITQVTVFELLQLNPMLEAALFEVDTIISCEEQP